MEQNGSGICILLSMFAVFMFLVLNFDWKEK
jgi:hypothetical protein